MVVISQTTAKHHDSFYLAYDHRESNLFLRFYTAILKNHLPFSQIFQSQVKHVSSSLIWYWKCSMIFRWSVSLFFILRFSSKFLIYFRFLVTKTLEINHLPNPKLLVIISKMMNEIIEQLDNRKYNNA